MAFASTECVSGRFIQLLTGIFHLLFRTEFQTSSCLNATKLQRRDSLLIVSIFVFCRINMTDFAVYSLILTMIAFLSEGKIHDTTLYLDEILSTIYPISIKQANLEVFDMPNFHKDMLHEFRDGAIANGAIYYHSGNLTGFQTVHLRICKEPTWEHGNLMLKCNILFPCVTIKYAINTRLAISDEDSEIIYRQRNFSLNCDIINMEAILEVLISPDLTVPLLKHLAIINDGKPVYYVTDIEIPEEPITLSIAQKFSDTLREILYDVYEDHFARALLSVPYSLERLKTEL